MRCIALGQAWCDAGGEVIFISAVDEPGICRRIEREKWDLVQVPEAHPSEVDMSVTQRVLHSALRNDPSVVWVVCDGYHFDERYQSELRVAGCRLLVVDDHNPIPRYSADILLNQNIGAAEIDYHCANDCIRLLGPEYALLRREIRTADPESRNSVHHRARVLITFGGSDPANVTAFSLGELQTLAEPRLIVRVVVGSMNPRFGVLQKRAAAMDGAVEVINAVDNMAPHLLWTDLAVCAAGSTCWELCYFGVPSIILSVAANQRAIASGLHQWGAAVSLGEVTALKAGSLTGAMNRLLHCPEERERMSRRGRQLVDGFGVQRVIDSMKSLK